MTANSYLQAFRGSIARIFDGNGRVQGAGFLVSGDRLLTCAHVANVALGFAKDSPALPEGSIQFDFPLIAPGHQLSAKVIFWRPMHGRALEDSTGVEDIAGLAIAEALPAGAAPVRLLVEADVWEHPFRVFGFPDKLDMGVWASGVFRDKTANSWIQLEDIKATGYGIQLGFSGSPVWDEQLQGVVGMTVAADVRQVDAKVAFAIPASILVKAWSELMPVGSLKQVGGEDALPSFPQVQVKVRRGYLIVLYKKYEAAYNQLSFTLNAADKPSIEQQIAALEREILQVEAEISRLVG